MQKKGGLDDHLPDDFNGRGKKGGGSLDNKDYPSSFGWRIF
jgi:hypothetical protein